MIMMVINLSDDSHKNIINIQIGPQGCFNHSNENNIGLAYGSYFGVDVALRNLNAAFEPARWNNMLTFFLVDIHKMTNDSILTTSEEMDEEVVDMDGQNLQQAATTEDDENRSINQNIDKNLTCFSLSLHTNAISIDLDLADEKMVTLELIAMKLVL